MPRRTELLRTTLELFLFLALLHLLYRHDFTGLNFFGFGPFYEKSRQLAVFGVYFATFAGHAWGPERSRKAVLLGGGLVSGMVAYPQLMLGLLLLVGLVYVIVNHLPAGTPKKVAALAILYIALGYAAAHSPQLQLLSLVFVGLTFFRTLLYLHAKATRRSFDPSFTEYLRYQLPAPSFIIHPYLGVIPPFGPPRKQRALEELLHDGRKLLWIGIATLLVARVISRVELYFFASTPEVWWLWHLWAMLAMMVALLDTAACAGFLVGMMMLLGWDLKPAMDRPWFSASLFEYWSRFIIHFKDMQVTLFYYPTVLALRRRPREVAILVAVAMTFLVGNNVVHILGRYIYTIERFTLLPHAIRANFALTAVMSVAFLWEEHKQRRRAAGKPIHTEHGGLLGKAIKVYLTLAIVSWIWHL